MAGILEKLATGPIREEMKRRVDEIIRAGAEWSKTAKELEATLNRLIEAIQKGNPIDLKPVNAGLLKLAKQTSRLSKAFDDHRKTLTEVLAKLG
ncbi:MAG: hypothetical protein QXX18_10580 [Candidatus Jordarchaeales archaeon]